MFSTPGASPVVGGGAAQRRWGCGPCFTSRLRATPVSFQPLSRLPAPAPLTQGKLSLCPEPLTTTGQPRPCLEPPLTQGSLSLCPEPPQPKGKPRPCLEPPLCKGRCRAAAVGLWSLPYFPFTGNISRSTTPQSPTGASSPYTGEPTSAPYKNVPRGTFHLS